MINTSWEGMMGESIAGTGPDASRARVAREGGTTPLSSYLRDDMTGGRSHRPVRVLVVDDHADVRFLVRAILQDAGPDVEYAGEAATAHDAVAALQAVSPDVVVLDARMPAVDGFEAAAMLLERRPGLPILLCSAVVDDEVRRRAEAAGIAACLSKDHFEAIPRVALDLARRS